MMPSKDTKDMSRPTMPMSSGNWANLNKRFNEELKVWWFIKIDYMSTIDMKRSYKFEL